MNYHLQSLFTACSISRVPSHFRPSDTTIPQKALWTLWLWSDLHDKVRVTLCRVEEMNSGAWKMLGLSLPGYHVKKKRNCSFKHFIFILQDLAACQKNKERHKHSRFYTSSDVAVATMHWTPGNLFREVVPWVACLLNPRHVFCCLYPTLGDKEQEQHWSSSSQITLGLLASFLLFLSHHP